MRKLDIAVATAGRFHVLDLARELHALGHRVTFYSYVPRARALRFGLPGACHVSLLPFVLPALAWERWLPNFAPVAREAFLFASLNRAVIMRLRRCDVFIGMSGIYLEAARHARQRFGARIWIERGSRHILSQDEILRALPGAGRPSPHAIARELAGYALADRISIPSLHVEESFREQGIAAAKLFRNPYGVDLSMFPLRAAPPPRRDATSLLYVGNWSLQKGCDILVDAVRQVPGTRLTHIGGINDLEFPKNDPAFRHIDSMDQGGLAAFYSSADVFILASQQDGFGMVLGQALASGLPLIATDRTGADDLAHTPALAARMIVVPHGDAAALAEAINTMRDRIAAGFAPLSQEDRATLSWAAYGRCYSEELCRDG